MSYHVIQRSDMFIQQLALFVLQSTMLLFYIEALFNFLLYIESIIVLLMPLLIIVQLLVDRLLSTL